MLRVDLICAGRLKEPYWISAAAEYEKRLSPFCKLTVTECPEGKPLTFTDNNALTVALCIEGRQYSSDDWASVFWGWVDGGRSRLRFLIGGSDGLTDEDKARAAHQLSLSAMTFPHHMARVLLLEQIYRAMTIRMGKAYHK
jgi:23S rRNA (pseudouridine1915-N3)-methyltransferase